MNLDNAIQKHGEWKLKFRVAISKQEIMDASTISQDNCCDLGKWLHGEAKIQYSKLESYVNCVAAHKKFHKVAGQVAEIINQKKFKEAEAMLENGSEYATASAAVGVSILKLKKDTVEK